MKISYSWLSSYFDKPLPAPEKLAELFNAHFAEVEGIEKADLPSGAADTVLDIKTLADRNHYALSHQGVASEASAITGLPMKKGGEKPFFADASVPKPSISVLDAKLCRRYLARRIESVSIGPSPLWLRDRLEAIGQRSINSVVDAMNFVMFDIGQPLHAFDADKVEGSITVRPARPGETITLLDGREIELRESDLLIADEKGPLVIAGVKGGKRAEVTESTRDIIIEAANFDPTAIRRTSTRHNIRNDSSKRFENEITPALAAEAMDRAVALIEALSPGAKAGPAADLYPSPVSPRPIAVDPALMNELTGLSLSEGEMERILTGLGCAVARKGSALEVTPPLVRLDLAIPEDFADEIARMHGYDRLPSIEAPVVAPTPVDPAFYWTEFAKSALVARGLSEVQTYSLVKKGAFEIVRPLASDKAALRERLAPKVAEALAQNAQNADLLGLEAIRIFEIARVFPKSGERIHIALGASQVKKKKGLTSEGIVEAEVKALEKALGTKLEGQIEKIAGGAVFEADFEAALAGREAGSIADLGWKPLSRDIRYKPFSAYPYIVRDIALFVPSGIPESDVAETIRSAARKGAGDLLALGPTLFDRFEKDGRVSYAFRMVFQSFERTLSDDEANGFMESAYTAAKAKGWEVR